MTCEIYEDMVAAHVDGVLSPTESQEIERHVASCSRCHQLFTEQKQFRMAFTARPLVVSVPHQVEQQLLQQLRTETFSRVPLWERLTAQWWGPRLFIGTAMASLLLVLLLSHFFSSQPQSLFTHAIDSYRLFIDQQQALAYKTTDPRQLSTTLNLSGELNFVTQVADLQPAGYQLRGGGVLSILSQQAAVAVYDGADDHIVCLRLGGQLPPMPAGAEFIHNHYVYSQDGYTVVYSQFRRHYCLLISRLAKDAFVRRLEKIPGA